MEHDPLAQFTDRFLSGLSQLSRARREAGPVEGTDRAQNLTITAAPEGEVWVEVQPSLIPGDGLRERVERAVAEAVRALLRAQQEQAQLPPGFGADLVKDAETLMSSGRAVIDARLSAATQQIARLSQGSSGTPRPDRDPQ